MHNCNSSLFMQWLLHYFNAILQLKNKLLKWWNLSNLRRIHLIPDWLLAERPRRFHKRSRDIGSVWQSKCNQTCRCHFKRLAVTCWCLNLPNVYDLLLEFFRKFLVVLNWKGDLHINELLFCRKSPFKWI